MANSQTGNTGIANPLSAGAGNEQVPVVEGYVPIFRGTPPLLLANNQVIRRPPTQRATILRRRRFFLRQGGYLAGFNRSHYPLGQRLLAVRLVGLGYTYRQVAAMISPHCSIGTIFRWRRQQMQRDHLLALRSAILRLRRGW